VPQGGAVRFHPPTGPDEVGAALNCWAMPPASRAREELEDAFMMMLRQQQQEKRQARRRRGEPAAARIKRTSRTSR
jgi:hypothetical protein